MQDIATQIEVWKKIVDVQQHFNDLELRIRNFALIVTGAFIGLGGYAIKDGGFITVLGVTMSIAGLVVFCAILPWFAFYLMDRLWYHRLLDGAVKAATSVETILNEAGIKIPLGAEISKASPVKVMGFTLHSRHKMDLFYGIIGVAIILLSMALAFGTKPIEQGKLKENSSVYLSGQPNVIASSVPTALACPPTIQNNIHLPSASTSSHGKHISPTEISK